MPKSYLDRLQQWIHTEYRMLSQKITVRPHCHWKSVTYLTLISSGSIVRKYRTSTNWNDASTASGPLWDTQWHSYWMCRWRVASASTRLRLCWRRTFWAHTVMKMMWCDTCDFFERQFIGRFEPQRHCRRLFWPADASDTCLLIFAIWYCNRCNFRRRCSIPSQCIIAVTTEPGGQRAKITHFGAVP